MGKINEKQKWPSNKKKYNENFDKIFLPDAKIMCACNGKACVGECREKNLERKRKDMKYCPAAFSNGDV